MTVMKVPSISIGQHRGRPAFRWAVNRRPRYRVIEQPDNPRAVERQRQELIAEIIAGPTLKTRAASLPEILAEFVAILRAKRSERYANESEKRIRRIITAGKIKRLDALTSDKVELVLAGMTWSNYDTRPLSEQSKNHIRASVRQFLRWCHRYHYIQQPVEIHLPKVRTKPGQRDRFQPDEAALLVKTALESSRVLQCYPGPLRAWLYRLALVTGLRRNELAALTPECFDLAGKTVRVASGYTKDGETATCPLPAQALPELSRWLGEHEVGQPLFPHLRMKRVREFVRRDMEEAGLPLRTAFGVRTFHSLRNTFISQLWDAGLPGPVVQKLARHSTMELTVAYSRERDGVRAAAVNLLPWV